MLGVLELLDTASVVYVYICMYADSAAIGIYGTGTVPTVGTTGYSQSQGPMNLTVTGRDNGC
jgi:hypothetical protein